MVRNLAWLWSCECRAEKVDTELSAGPCDPRRCTCRLGISNREVRVSSIGGRARRMSPCAPMPLGHGLPLQADTCGHPCPRDWLSVSTGATGVSRLSRARGVAARMCAVRVQVRQPAGPPRLKPRRPCRPYSVMSHVVRTRLLRARRAARRLVDPARSLASAARPSPRGVISNRACVERPPPAAVVDEWGWWWERIEERGRSGCRRRRSRAWCRRLVADVSLFC